MDDLGVTPMTSEISVTSDLCPGFQPAGNGFFGKATPPPVGCGKACPDFEAQVEPCQVPLRVCPRMLGTYLGHLHSYFFVGEKS